MNHSVLPHPLRTVLLLSLCLAVSPALGVSAQAQDQNVQVIEMTAKKYEFLPSPVHVKKGQKVQLKVTATDHDHGLKIPLVPDGADKTGAPGLTFTDGQECYKVKKGTTLTIEFTAQTPGTYTFKCCVDCGLGHRHMKGEIVVDE